MRFPSFLRLRCQKERRGFAHVMPQQKMMLVARLGVDTGAERWREDDILPYKKWKMGRMKAGKNAKMVRKEHRKCKKCRIQHFFHYKSSQYLFTFLKSCAII